MIPIRHFYMIRHGQTEANAAKIMAGSLDSPLTQTGREQARLVHAAVKSLKTKPTRIIHSHLSRARDTATIINEALNLPMHEDSDYAEMHAGDWEGAHYDECHELLKGWIDPPGGEPYEAFLNRIKTAKIRALNQKDIPLIVSHGGVFRAFFKLHDIHKEGVQNCKLYEFTPKEKTEIDTNISRNIEGENFPWHVWRYDIDQENPENALRVSVKLDTHPGSEIS